MQHNIRSNKTQTHAQNKNTDDEKESTEWNANENKHQATKLCSIVEMLTITSTNRTIRSQFKDCKKTDTRMQMNARTHTSNAVHTIDDQNMMK